MAFFVEVTVALEVSLNNILSKAFETPGLKENNLKTSKHVCVKSPVLEKNKKYQRRVCKCNFEVDQKARPINDTTSGSSKKCFLEGLFVMNHYQGFGFFFESSPPTNSKLPMAGHKRAFSTCCWFLDLERGSCTIKLLFHEISGK